MLGWLKCLWRGRHTPTRQFLGGFRCAVCGLAGADLEEMGYPGSSDVPTLRTLFGRDHQGRVTITRDWR